MARYFLLVGILLATGCSFYYAANTKLVSFKDPSIPPKQYQNMVVWSREADLEKRATTEEIFINNLSKWGDKITLRIVRSTSVVSPVKPFSFNEFMAKVREQKFDGVISILLTESTTDSVYVPEVTTKETEIKEDQINEGTIRATETTKKEGGIFLSSPKVRYQIELVDVSTWKAVWVASTYTDGQPYDSFESLLGSLTYKAIERLYQDQLLQKRIVK